MTQIRSTTEGLELESSSSGSYRSENLDHYGLLAAGIQDLKLIDKINLKIGSKDPRRRLQPGQATAAMLINGMGFFNRTIYLTPDFFINLPVERLLGEGIRVEDLTEQTLGKTLDEIYAYGPSRWFGELAMEMAMEQGLLESPYFLDSTSFSLEGAYNKQDKDSIQIARGYSKDGRPEAMQVMLGLVCNAKVPLWAEPQNGNASDKKEFSAIIKRFEKFKSQLGKGVKAHKHAWVCDAALYTAENIRNHQDIHWTSRVPETNQDAKKLIALPHDQIPWMSVGEGYSISQYPSHFGNVEQTWILVHSEQAQRREVQTFRKRLEKSFAKYTKAAWHLSHRVFNCQEDAIKALKNFEKTLPESFELKSNLFEKMTFESKGRPRKEAKGTAKHQLALELHINQAKTQAIESTKGRFILATNSVLGPKDGKDILDQYKELQVVERGFRFLKDPLFMADAFFLKKSSRIEALMALMALMLFVYMYLQNKLREKLEQTDSTVPNQKRKPIKNPTMRWIFSMFRGVSVVYHTFEDKTHTVITNLSITLQSIVRLMGDAACRIYAIPPPA